MGVAVIPKETKDVVAIARDELENRPVMLRKQFKKELLRDIAGKAWAGHEAFHAILGKSEAGADTGMFLERAALGEQGLPEKIERLAAFRAFTSLDEPTHDTVDALLRQRNDFIKHPERIKKETQGQEISIIGQLAQINYVEPSEKSEAKNKKNVAEVTQYAKAALKAEEDGKAPPPLPKEMTPEAARKLLTLQYLTEKYSIAGDRNGVSKAMPQLWAAHPAAFAEARGYMRAHYGIDMQPPAPQAPKLASSNPKATPAATTPH